MGSLVGSPATHARPSSCAFVRRYVQTPGVRPYTSKKPASLRRFGLSEPVFWPFWCAATSRARGVPKSRERRVAAGAAPIEMRRIKRYFHIGSESVGPSCGAWRLPPGAWCAQAWRRDAFPPRAGRSQLAGPRRASNPVFLLPWRAAGIQLPGRAARDSTRRKTPPPPSKNFCCV